MPNALARLPSLDDLEDTELPDFCQRAVDAWNVRDRRIADARELYEQTWQVTIPPGWDAATGTQHTALSREIPQRVIGTLTISDPVFTRPNPSDQWDVGKRGNAVERFFRGKFARDRRTALAGMDLYRVNAAQLVHTGAVCNASLYAPAVWAGPLLRDDDGNTYREWWRDGLGRPTEDATAIDEEASYKAYSTAVQRHRQSGVVPLVRRAVPTVQCYPVFSDGGMTLEAMVLKREVTLLEAARAGFWVETEGGKWSATETFWEVATPNRVRWLRGTNPVGHEASGGDEQGITTNYGFVPYAYCAGYAGYDFSPDGMGLPLLTLIDSNLRNLTMLRTYHKAAIHTGTFISFQLVDTGPANPAQALVPSQVGQQLRTFEFKSGQIMEPPTGKRIEPLVHPGLNADFWKLQQFEVEEINRLIPRTISGQAESSGYNTATASAQAKTIFNPLFSALERLEESIATMDMRHLVERVDGPVALDVPSLGAVGSARPPKYERVSLAAKDLDGYLGITVSIDREPDRITLGQNAARLLVAGIGDKEWAADQAGILDYEDMIARQARDHVLSSEKLMATIEDDAIKQFGLEQRVKEAEAATRIQQTAAGPAVQMPNGQLAGPGLAASMGAPALSGPASSPLGPPPTAPGPATSQGQGPVGGLLGGANARSPLPGGPNLGSTNNPTITMPLPTAANRPRQRRRGGAIPGAPQRQNAFKPAPAPIR